MRSDDVVHLAEQATLGALLLDPSRFAEVNRWLRGWDFADPWHRQVWVLMREAHAAGEPADALTLGRALMDRGAAHQQHLLRVHDLLAAVPRDVDPRPHARVVVEFGLRREVAAQGVLIEAAALSAARHQDSGPINSSTRVVGAVLLVAGERWADAHARPVSGLTARIPIPVLAAGTDLELRRAADKYLANGSAVDVQAVRINEKRLVACLVTHPTAIAPCHAWLAPHRLTNAPWRAIYAALGEMAERGESIDVVAVSARLLRTTSRTGPDVAALREAVDAEMHSVPGHLRRPVAGDQLRRLARSGSAALRESAANPAVPLEEVLGRGHALLDDLRQIAGALPDRNEPEARRSTLSLVRNVEHEQHVRRDEPGGPVAG